jgi:hypothetical protein
MILKGSKGLERRSWLDRMKKTAICPRFEVGTSRTQVQSLSATLILLSGKCSENISVTVRA